MYTLISSSCQWALRTRYPYFYLKWTLLPNMIFALSHRQIFPFRVVKHWSTRHWTSSSTRPQKANLTVFSALCTALACRVTSRAEVGRTNQGTTHLQGIFWTERTRSATEWQGFSRPIPGFNSNIPSVAARNEMSTAKEIKLQASRRDAVTISRLI